MDQTPEQLGGMSTLEWNLLEDYEFNIIDDVFLYKDNHFLSGNIDMKLRTTNTTQCRIQNFLFEEFCDILKFDVQVISKKKYPPYLQNRGRSYQRLTGSDSDDWNVALLRCCLHFWASSSDWPMLISLDTYNRLEFCHF